MKGVSITRRHAQVAATAALRRQADASARSAAAFEVSTSPYTGVEFHRAEFTEVAKGRTLRCVMQFTVEEQARAAMPAMETGDSPSRSGAATEVMSGTISVWDESDEHCLGEVTYRVLDAPASDGTTVRVAHVGNIEFEPKLHNSGIGSRMYARIIEAHPEVEAFPASDILEGKGPRFRRRLAEKNPDLYRGRFDEDNVVHWNAAIRGGFLNSGGIPSNTRGE